MAFQKFVLVRNETRRDNADAETGIIFGGYVYDTDHPAHPRRADFVIDGEEYEALSAVPETRAYQVEGIIKREVAALYAAWAATLGPAPEAPSTQPSPAVPVGEMLDLSNAATAYDPDINSWADGWGEPPAPSSPEFVSAALNLTRTAVIVTFSEGMVSPAAGHMAGVTIK
ncbi:MAG TPA: hypothetical protein VGV38_17380, partial [Pyrinomonadaceae bacterium]|nr:hypothetical protein [Pyrinomonadaceae bacterium]